MCGINGIVVEKKSINTRKEIVEMNDLILHRGPDSEVFFVEDDKDYSVSLGMKDFQLLIYQQETNPCFQTIKK